jgi:glycerol-3-phosphate O-acyltransferase
MFQVVEIPLWLLVLILLFAAVTFASHFLFPSVRWFVRRRAERVVAELNKRLERPIEPFKLLRRQDRIQRVIYDPEVVRAVQQHAAETGVREDVAFETARRYAREIVPSFSATAYFTFAIRAARIFARMIYDVEVHPPEAGRVRALDPDATVVFVMNHRSNMDYVLVTYLAADTSALSYAVGEWARIWPLSRLIRAMGAYFIRRRSRNALYRAVLARYVAMATSAGVTQAMFPEGGLSRDGGLGMPKLGLYSYFVEAHRESGRDVVFIPVSLNYDRVIEDRVLVAAQSEGRQRFRASLPEGVAFVLRYAWRRATRQLGKFGRAAVVFGDPISLRGLGGEAEVDVAALAQAVKAEHARQMPVLPWPLFCAALLRLGGRARPEAVEAEMQRLLGALPDGTPVFGRDAAEVEAPCKGLLARKVLRMEGGEVTAAVPELVAFYARSLAPHLDAAPAIPQAQQSRRT